MLTSLFAPHVAQLQYVDNDRGRTRTEVIDALFTNAYIAELEEYDKVIELVVAAKSGETSELP